MFSSYDNQYEVTQCKTSCDVTYRPSSVLLALSPPMLTNIPLILWHIPMTPNIIIASGLKCLLWRRVSALWSSTSLSPGALRLSNLTFWRDTVHPQLCLDSHLSQYHTLCFNWPTDSLFSFTMILFLYSLMQSAVLPLIPPHTLLNSFRSHIFYVKFILFCPVHVYSWSVFCTQ